MSATRDPVEELKQHHPDRIDEISQHAEQPVFQDLCEDMVFLIEQIAQSRDPLKRKMLTDLKKKLDAELDAILSKQLPTN